MNIEHDNSPQIIISEYPLPFAGSISHAYLDLPKAGEYVLNRNSVVKIFGWALTKTATDSFKVIIKQQEIEHEYHPTISRPDVLDHFENGSGKGTLREKCGFYIEVTLHASLEIYLKTDEALHLWKHLRLTNNSDRLSILAWKNFITNNLEQISEEQSLSLQKVELNFIKSIITEKAYKIFKPIEVSKINSLSKTEHAYFQKFINKTKSESFCVNLIDSIRASNNIKLPHPFKEGISTSKDSYHYINGRTLLRFTTDNNETFFLIQYVSSGDALFFPNRNIIVLDYHLSYDDVVEHIQALCKNFNYVLEKSKIKNQKFGGIIASHGRPYHFYYDTLPAINLLNKSQLLHTAPQIIMNTGGDFLSIKDLYSLNIEETVLNSNEIERSTQTNQSFYIQAGIRYQSNNEIDNNNILDLDSKIREYSIKNKTNSAKQIIDKTKKCFPLIWF